MKKCKSHNWKYFNKLAEIISPMCRSFSMKKIIPLLLLLSNNLFAQSPTQQKETGFDKFINKPEIEWAAYINDTTRFEKVNLNKILFTRLIKNEIKASLPVGSGTPEADQVKYLKKRDIDRVRFSSNEIPVFDSAGNMIGVRTQTQDIDTASFTLTDVTQILFIEKGQLKTFVPWVATMLPVVTSQGINLGDGDYFSTCFNYKYNYQPPKQNKVTWLANTKRKIIFESFDARNKLKELYGRNPVQTLWPYILKNKIAVFDYEKNTRIKVTEFTTDLINEAKTMIPVYDSLGNQIGQRANYSELDPNVFTAIELIQEWNYDHTGNIVFIKIKEAYLYARKWKANGDAGNQAPILKLVFQ